MENRAGFGSPFSFQVSDRYQANEVRSHDLTSPRGSIYLRCPKPLRCSGRLANLPRNESWPSGQAAMAPARSPLKRLGRCRAHGGGNCQNEVTSACGRQIRTSDCRPVPSELPIQSAGRSNGDNGLMSANDGMVISRAAAMAVCRHGANVAQGFPRAKVGEEF